MNREPKRCKNCGDAYPWWRRYCHNHVFKVPLILARDDPHDRYRKVPYAELIQLHPRDR